MSRRVFAVRYAHREAVRSEHFYDPSPPDPHDAPMAMDYYLWAITGDDGPIVVDAAILSGVERVKAGLGRKDYASIATPWDVGDS